MFAERCSRYCDYFYAYELREDVPDLRVSSCAPNLLFLKRRTPFLISPTSDAELRTTLFPVGATETSQSVGPTGPRRR
jgi:hypothetical protein